MWEERGGGEKGPIGQEIKCAVSHRQSHVSQVIAYCLLPSGKVGGHGDHIHFFFVFSVSPSLLSSPTTRRNKERRRRSEEGWIG